MWHQGLEEIFLACKKERFAWGFFPFFLFNFLKLTRMKGERNDSYLQACSKRVIKIPPQIFYHALLQLLITRSLNVTCEPIWLLHNIIELLMKRSLDITKFIMNQLDIRYWPMRYFKWDTIFSTSTICVKLTKNSLFIQNK